MLHSRHHHPETIGERVDALMVAVFVADEEERIRRISEHVARDFLYVSPGGVFEGAEGLSEAFSGYRHDAWRHTLLRRTSAVDVHHEHFRYAWERHEGADTVTEGMSFGWVNPEGRLSRIVAFNGLIPGHNP